MRKYIRKVVQYKKIPHAFILNRGTREDAVYFAKSILCGSPSPNGEPCGVCRSCELIESGSNPDATFIAPDKNKKTLGVDDAREKINNVVQIKPYLFKYRIFIIESADVFTVQAQNALLKVLEEPPSYGVFILLSENFQKFLPTILSRCVLLKNPPPPLPPSDMEIIERVLALRTAPQVFELAKEKSDSAQNFLTQLAVWFRDVLVYRETRDEKLIINQDKINLIKSLNYSAKYLTELLDEINASIFNLNYNVNAELTLDAVLLRAIEL
jgi:DNA polymerase-3 subunit delta'